MDALSAGANPRTGQFESVTYIRRTRGPSVNLVILAVGNLSKDQVSSGLWIQESFVPSGLMLFFGPDVPALKRWAITKQDASTRNVARGKAGLSKRRGYSGTKE